MSNQDNLNNANELGRTIAALIAQPYGLSLATTNVVDGLVAALADKARELLSPPAIKASSPSDDLVIGAGDTAHIHGNGDVELVRSGTIVNMMASPDASPHASDCATNNRGVPELLGPCDCAPTDEIYGHFPDLYAYLANAYLDGAIDHVVRVVLIDGKRAGAYIRPMNTSGDTMSFNVLGDAPCAKVAA